jgi:hypothetical protein
MKLRRERKEEAAVLYTDRRRVLEPKGNAILSTAEE